MKRELLGQPRGCSKNNKYWIMNATSTTPEPGISTDADAIGDIQLTFEEALRELEEVVATLETGNVPLEQTILLAQRGNRLAGLCDEILGGAEATLEELFANSDGELVTKTIPYEDEDDEYTEE